MATKERLKKSGDTPSNASSTIYPSAGAMPIIVEQTADCEA